MKQILALLLCALLSGAVYGQTPEEQLKKMNLQLPPVSQPVANYVKYVRTGNLIFLAGHGPSRTDGTSVTGKVGVTLNLQEGYEAAKITALSLIATLKDALGGDLSRVKRIVKVNGYVNCPADFTDHPKVINGCSDLLVAVFGEKGKHARAAMGMGSLPNNIAVEIEMVVEVEE
jgi:enamine deaminase RidA (YjgF/YER057c/UK114 family)